MIDGGGWSTPPSGRFTPQERPNTHCIGGGLGPRARLDSCRKSRPPPGFDPRIVEPVAGCYTDWAIPAWKSLIIQLQINIVIVSSRMRRMGDVAFRETWHFLQIHPTPSENLEWTVHVSYLRVGGGIINVSVELVYWQIHGLRDRGMALRFLTGAKIYYILDCVQTSSAINLLTPEFYI